MKASTKILIGFVGLVVLGGAFYFGRKSYLKSRTSSDNPQKNERKIKTVVNP